MRTIKGASLIFLVLVAACAKDSDSQPQHYNGAFSFVYGGKGEFQEIGNCLFNALGGPEAVLIFANGYTSKQHLVSIDDQKLEYEIVTKALHNSSNGEKAEAANEITVYQTRAENSVAITIRHVTNAGFAKQTQLTALINKYLPACVDELQLSARS